MGIAGIVGFALCWVFVATVMLWAVLTEDRRDGFDPRIPIRWVHPARTRARRRGPDTPAVDGPGVPAGDLAGPGGPVGDPAEPPGPEADPVQPTVPSGRPAAHPAGGGRPPVASPEWIVVATADGANEQALEEARLVLSAWLAAWGLDQAEMRPDDVRTEQVSGQDGPGFTRILVRASALPRAPRHRLGG